MNMSVKRTAICDIGSKGQLVKLHPQDLMKLPAPYDDPNLESALTEPKEEWKKNYITTLDGYIGINVPVKKPETKEEEYSNM